MIKIYKNDNKLVHVINSSSLWACLMRIILWNPCNQLNTFHISTIFSNLSKISKFNVGWKYNFCDNEIIIMALSFKNGSFVTAMNNDGLTITWAVWPFGRYQFESPDVYTLTTDLGWKQNVELSWVRKTFIQKLITNKLASLFENNKLKCNQLEQLKSSKHLLSTTK